ncbi:MAG: YlxM family DNA-binding protein [Clostridia bacterium]|nr:YlxM family DNA-binding protein [Clostridia bacterium]
MYEKNLEIAYLLDYYGGMLTDKQREVVDLYYNEDLSLAEIAEHAGITRQGVRDSIKRGEEQILEMEEKLGLVARIRSLEKTLNEILDLSEELERYAADNVYVRPLAELAKRIRKAADELNTQG